MTWCGADVPAEIPAVAGRDVSMAVPISTPSRWLPYAPRASSVKYYRCYLLNSVFTQAF